MDENLRPSQEDLDMITELRISKRKYEKKLETTRNPSLVSSKSPNGNRTNVNIDRLNNTISSIDSMLDFWDRFHRFTPEKRTFVIKLIKNAAMLTFNELKKEDREEKE